MNVKFRWVVVSFSVKQKSSVQREKKRNYIKALVLHRACGLSFASRKKSFSYCCYLTLSTSPFATNVPHDWEFHDPFFPIVQTQHGVFLFWHIWLEKLWKKIPRRAGQSRMASFHVYHLPHEILISCKVGETNNLRQLIRDIRGEKKKNMKKQLAQCGRL